MLYGLVFWGRIATARMAMALKSQSFESVKTGSKIWVPLLSKRGQGEVMRLEPGRRLQLMHQSALRVLNTRLQ
jgi:hypothetical protein